MSENIPFEFLFNEFPERVGSVPLSQVLKGEKAFLFN